MSTRRKWVIAAIVLLVLGLAICGAGLVFLKRDFSKLTTGALITNTYDVKDTFRSIRITADTENIVLVPSDTDACRVVCREKEDGLHLVRVEDGTLTVDRPDRHGLQFGIVTEAPVITVYLPGKNYEALSVDSDTGDVEIPEAFSFDRISVTLSTGDVRCSVSSAGSVSVETTTGDIRISGVKCEGDMSFRVNTGAVTAEDVSCRRFASDGTTGEISLKNVLVSEDIRIERSTGDVEFDSCDADSVFVNTTTGSVSGTLLTEKVFLTETSTGDVKVPDTASGGRCEITTATGDISLKIK